MKKLFIVLGLVVCLVMPVMAEEATTTEETTSLISLADSIEIGVDTHYLVKNKELATGMSISIATLFNDNVEIKGHYLPDVLSTGDESSDLYGLGPSINVVKLCKKYCGDIKLDILKDWMDKFEVNLGVAGLVDMQKSFDNKKLEGDVSIYFKLIQVF